MSGDRTVGAIRKTRHLSKLGVGYLRSILPPFSYFEYVSKFHIKKKTKFIFFIYTKAFYVITGFPKCLYHCLH